MLININPVLSPDLLFHLRSMGHGEKIILADANFPANSMNKNVIRLDGVDIKSAANAILSVFPLDSFTVSQGGSSALRMEVDDKPEELTETHKEFIEAVKK
jgi:L-fucose mutarotase